MNGTEHEVQEEPVAPDRSAIEAMDRIVAKIGWEPVTSQADVAALVAAWAALKQELGCNENT